jgi:two-component system response regulator HydG
MVPSNSLFDDSRLVTLDELEQNYINHVLVKSNGKKSRAAQILGIDKTTLWRKLKRMQGEE